MIDMDNESTAVAVAVISALAGAVLYFIVFALFESRSANDSQKKIQLFGRRKVVHDKVMAFLAGIEGTGKPPEYANLQQFLRDTKDSDLLFGQEVASFVNEVYSKALAYKTHHQVWEPMGDGPERTAKYEDVRKAADAVQECWVRACTPNSNVFRTYLELT